MSSIINYWYLLAHKGLNDLEQTHSRINIDCRRFWPHRPSSASYKNSLCPQVMKAYKICMLKLNSLFSNNVAMSLCDKAYKSTVSAAFTLVVYIEFIRIMFPVFITNFQQIITSQIKLSGTRLLGKTAPTWHILIYTNYYWYKLHTRESIFTA